MITMYNLRWTSMNQPLDGREYYWQLGTIIDFHIEPLQGEQKLDRKFYLTDNNLTPTTRLIVTDIEDTKEESATRVRFQITLFVFENGKIIGDPIKMGYRSAPCHQACWLEKVDSYLVQIPVCENPTVVTEHGMIFKLTS